MRPRACPFQDLQLEREQLFGNGLRSRTQTRKHGATAEPDLDGRLVRRPESRSSADLRLFATKPQICTYLRLDHVARGVSSGWRRPSTRLRCVIGEHLRLRRWKGCVWIDIDERVAGLQRTRVGPQAVIAGGSWRIPEVQHFAKRAYGALQVSIHTHFEVLKWVIIHENSSDSGHYFLPSPGSKEPFTHILDAANPS